MSRHSTEEVFGYVEGYYGKLLTWEERASLIDELAAQGFNTYFYGPKDDAKHRLFWREHYGEGWRNAFRSFTSHAHDKGVSVIAGIAPGLDFNFAGLTEASNASRDGATTQQSGDYILLLSKAQQLVDDGADAIGLMMDDIDADFRQRNGEFQSEGAAHATLANCLQQDLRFSQSARSSAKVYCVPRIYANELLQQTDLIMPAVSDTFANTFSETFSEASSGNSADSNGNQDRDAIEYMRSFTSILQQDISWLYCGTHVVARQPDIAQSVESGAQIQHRIVIWDNYYANDYCPRRLFLGVWTGRDTCSELLLNGTGMPHTDRLLLQVVAAIRLLPITGPGNPANKAEHAWQQCLLQAGVPEEFFLLKEFFDSPVFSDSSSDSSEITRLNKDPIAAEAVQSPTLLEQQLAAIDHLLWRWKAPLAREWYPYLFGLKHDLMIANGTLPDLRIRKTQTPPLAGFVTSLKPEQEH